MKEPQGPESPMITQLDLLIEITQEQAKAMHTTALPGQRRRKESDEPSSSPPIFDDLDLFLGRVSQIKAWLLHDPQLLQVVDTHISQHVQRMERRQSMQNIWLSILNLLVGAILGWLASALTPPLMLWHLLIH